MVRSQLDYCSSVSSPYKKGNIDTIEKVQKRATKVLPELKNKSYIERLKCVTYPHCTSDKYVVI